MKILRTAGIGAAVVIALTGAARQDGVRYRYLGPANIGEVLASEASGPQTARRLRVIVASPAPTLPGDADSVEIAMIIDCTAHTAGIERIATFRGAEERLRTDAGGRLQEINAGSSNELVYAQACGGAIAAPPIWLDGAAKARAYALARVQAK